MKRLAKILFAGLVLILLWLAGLTVYIKIKYPAERLKELLIARLADDYNVRLAIARLRINLFSGFEIENLEILETRQPLPEAYRSPLHIERVTLAYRWRSLFARRLDIDAMIFEKPSLRYWRGADSVSNLEAMLAAFYDSTATPTDTSAGLPISIHLKSLVLRDLQINTAVVSIVDTQYVEGGPIDVEMTEIEVDRRAKYRLKFKLDGKAARLRYSAIPVGKGSATHFISTIMPRFEGSLVGDSLEVRAALRLEEGSLSLQDSAQWSLPPLSANAQAHYHVASSALIVPDFRFALDGVEQLVGHFKMYQQEDMATFECQIDHGVIDLTQLSKMLRTNAIAEHLTALRHLNVGGHVEFSGSELRGNQNDMRYRLALRGRDLMYEDLSSGFKIERANLQMDWRPSSEAADSSATTMLIGKFDFAACAVPVDTLNAIASGPGTVEFDFLLTEDFLPQRANLQFEWQQLAEGKLSGRAEVRPAPNAHPNRAWLSKMQAEAEFIADSVELSHFSAGTMHGKISGKIALQGKRLDALQFTGTLRNSRIAYDDGVEYKGEIPPYHLAAAAEVSIDSALTRIVFENGRLHGEPGSVRFRADYDLNNASLSVDHLTATLAL
ncbi:MAG: AsmA family protein, partial [candidate division KSB1 bacterium]|nr:AsmA family protein [candidate division KSB1 bacterium]